MAQKTIVLLEDDLDGGEATQTVGFGLDGVEYEIDLSDKNAQKLRSVLERYSGAARRTGGRAKRGTATSRTGAEQTSAIREWARESGYEVNDRGRIPSHIVEAYHSS